MKSELKILLFLLLFITVGIICYTIFKRQEAFTLGFLGALTTDYLYYKYKGK